MTRIGAIGGGIAAPRRGARREGAFALPSGSAAAEARAASAAVEISGLLSLQEQPAPARLEGAMRRAEAALDELRGMQLDLLRGQDDPERLARLAALSDSEAVKADPVLREVLSAIALRARVELARRRVALRGVS
jgi:hypothetical protein